MNSSPCTRKTFVILALLALLAPLALGAFTASSASAVTAATKYQNGVKTQINTKRIISGKVALKNGAAAACHDRAAQWAARYVTAQSTLAPRYIDVAGSCAVETLGYAVARAKNPGAALRQMMRRPTDRRSLTHFAGRHVGIGAKRNADGTWSTVVMVAAAAPRPATVMPEPTPTPDPTTEPAPEPAPVTLTGELLEMRTSIYSATNAARADNGGLSALSVHTCLQTAAQKWATKLADRDTGLEHQNLALVFDVCPGFTTLGENIGYQYDSNGVLLTGAWMASPGHRANILKPEFNRIGVGVARAASGRWYGVQVFAYKRLSPPGEPREVLRPVSTNPVSQPELAPGPGRSRWP